MTELIRRLTDKYTNKSKYDSFTPGDTVNVHVKVKEGEKERIQVYKGVVIKIQKSGVGRCFTVRKISNGIGVERTFPFASPAIEKVEALARGKVRRSRLYYLRGLRGKAARLETELVTPTRKKETKEKKEKKETKVKKTKKKATSEKKATAE